MACRRWRQGADNKFFPTPGQLLELCTPPFADKPGKSHGRQTEHGFQPWNGSCQCEACMKQTSHEGFYRASNADHARDAQIRGELDYAMEQKLGYDPKKGNPELDDTIDRQRSPEDLKAVMASARAKYPRAFGKFVPEKLDREPIPYVETPPELLAERMAKLEAKLPDPVET